MRRLGEAFKFLRRNDSDQLTTNKTTTFLQQDSVDIAFRSTYSLRNSIFLPVYTPPFEPLGSALNMRLLKSNADGSFGLTRFTGNNVPSYAILSHVWEADDQEVTFHDLINCLGSNKKGYRKIQFCSEQAERDGLRYFWVDSCCVDKSSSIELQTAINSMFAGTGIRKSVTSTSQTSQWANTPGSLTSHGNRLSGKVGGSPEAGHFKNFLLRNQSSFSPEMASYLVIRAR